jgi:hypothetical protein
MRKSANHVSRLVVLKSELQYVKAGIHYYSNSIPADTTTREDPSGVSSQSTIGPRVS